MRDQISGSRRSDPDTRDLVAPGGDGGRQIGGRGADQHAGGGIAVSLMKLDMAAAWPRHDLLTGRGSVRSHERVPSRYATRLRSRMANAGYRGVDAAALSSFHSKPDGLSDAIGVL